MVLTLSSRIEPVVALVTHDNSQVDVLFALPFVPPMLSAIVSPKDSLPPTVCGAGSAWGNQRRHVVLDLSSWMIPHGDLGGLPRNL